MRTLSNYDSEQVNYQTEKNNEIVLSVMFDYFRLNKEKLITDDTILLNLIFISRLGRY